MCGVYIYIWNKILTWTLIPGDVQLKHNAQNMKFSINDFFSKSDEIRSFVRIWSYSLMENFIFCAVTFFWLVCYLE